jgi:predicted Fe-S protein YdhL (DUF1289 family)
MNDRSSLDWFLKFINLDTAALSDSDRHKWIRETVYMIDGGSPYRKFQAVPRKEKAVSKKIGEWENSDKLEKCQGYIKDFINELMSNIERYISERSEWKPYNQFRRKSTFHRFETRGTLRVQLPLTSGTEHKSKNKRTNDGETLYRITSEEMNKSKFRIIFDAQSDQESLLMALCQSLDRVPVGCLRQCPECRDWFLHLSKKEKIYCTPKCAARHVSRRRRQKLKKENPEKYKRLLTENAKRARKSYEKNKEKRIRM